MFNDDPHYSKLYFEKYLPYEPGVPGAATFMETGVVHTTNDIIPQSELVKTRFYREWVEPQGIVDAIAVNLEKGTTRSSLLNIRMLASDGVADERAMRRARLLVPRFQRAVAIGRLFDQHKAVETALTETLDHVEAAGIPGRCGRAYRLRQCAGHGIARRRRTGAAERRITERGGAGGGSHDPGYPCCRGKG